MNRKVPAVVEVMVVGVMARVVVVMLGVMLGVIAPAFTPSLLSHYDLRVSVRAPRQ